MDLVTDLIRSDRIRLGMTRGELELVLGVPDDTGVTSRKYPVPSILRYGDVQFVFPPARNRHASEHLGLSYVYIDYGVEGVEEPIFLLR